MGIKKSSRVRNSSQSPVNLSSGSQARNRNSSQPVRNLRPSNKGIITTTGRTSRISFNKNNLAPSTPQQVGRTQQQAQSTPQQVGPTQAQAQTGPTTQPRTRSFFNRLRGREVNINNRQLNNNDKKEIFSQLSKNITFILQRHATSCANIINKGFETGSTSYLTFGKTRLVAEIAPDSMLPVLELTNVIKSMII